MKILVTGGLGFIGSHTTIELINNGHEVVIVDNLVNSKIEVLDRIEKITKVRPKFYKINLTILEDVRKIFDENEFDSIIHFAGLKAVGESIEKPVDYYDNNLGSTLNLLRCMKEKNIFNMVFSSSACVYGEPKENPIDETFSSNNATNPYGRTKIFIEEILNDVYISDNRYNFTILRYFNPVGAHSSGLIGEDPNGIPNNLMPYILKVAKGERDKLNIFGNDYNTEDGTCIRDFIHVVDLAIGHVKAIENVKNAGVHIYNLGTGKGTSVLELVKTFNKVNGDLVKFEFVDKRAGDVPVNYAKADKAKAELDWVATKTIEDMCKDAWNFAKNKK
jgi:UDP-glucose 4-epimerase